MGDASMRPRGALAALVTVLVAAGLLAARGAGAEPAAAGGGDAGARPTTARSGIQAVAPPRGGPLEEERDPGRGPRPHEPVFLEPAAITTERARLGLSTWITPGAPSEHRENPGGIAIGFTIAWPAPPGGTPPRSPSPWRGSAAR
jgi:hypothetical protein